MIGDAASAGLFLAVAAVALGLAVLAVRRQRRLERFAKQHGLLFDSGDPRRLAERPFRLFRLGDGRSCEESMWGTWNGVEVTEAKYSYWKVDREGREGIRRTFSAAAVDVGAAVPFLSIQRADLAATMADRLGFHDLQFESEEFNRRFEVKAEDREFAYKLIDARMLEWLLGAGGRFGYESGGTGILVYGHPKLKPEELSQIFDAAAGFAGHVPRLVRTEHPVESEASGFAKEAGLQFSPADPGGLLAGDFKVFRFGQGRLLRNVVWGRWSDRKIWAGELDLQDQEGALAEGWTPPPLSVAWTEAPPGLPAVAVVSTGLLPQAPPAPEAMRWAMERGLQRAPERLARLREEEQRLMAEGSQKKLARVRRQREAMEQMLPRMARAAGLAERGIGLAGALGVDVGPDEFQRAFVVLTDQEAEARRVIDEALIGWLLLSGAGFGFEVSGSGALAYCRRLPAADLPKLLEALAGFRDRAARSVPSPPGLEGWTS